MIKRCKIGALTILSALIISSCSDKKDDVHPAVVPDATGVFIDVRDGIEYKWVRYDDLDWMSENLKYDISDENNSTIYQKYGWEQEHSLSTDYLDKYGFLYTLTGAELAIPTGWRLPTDKDWCSLEAKLGMSSNQIQSRGWRGNKTGELLKKGNNQDGINAIMAGYYTPYTIMATSGYRFMGSYGFFWTNSPDTTKEGDYYFYRKLFYGSGEVYRESMEPNKAMLSVRLVRDVK